MTPVILASATVGADLPKQQSFQSEDPRKHVSLSLYKCLDFLVPAEVKRLQSLYISCCSTDSFLSYCIATLSICIQSLKSESDPVYQQPDMALTPLEVAGAGVTTLPPTRSNGPMAPTSSHGERVNGKSGAELETEKDVESALDPESPPMPILQPTISKTIGPSGAPAQQAMSRWHLIVVAALVTFTLCMSSAGSMCLYIALPTIQDDLNMNEHDLQWIAAAYSLTNGCFLLLAGRLADIHGRKLLFLVRRFLPSRRPAD
jgi:hypothetical protein